MNTGRDVGSGIGNILDNCSENSQIFIVGPYTYTVVYFWYVDHNSGILTIFLVRYGDHISGMVTRPYFLYVDHTSGILTIFLVYRLYFWYVDKISGMFTKFLVS